MKTDSSMKTATKSRKAYYALIPLGLLLVVLLLYYESVLIEAGGFLAPEGRGDGKCRTEMKTGGEMTKELTHFPANWLSLSTMSFADTFQSRAL
jgi:hypothetical protein